MSESSAASPASPVSIEQLLAQGEWVQRLARMLVANAAGGMEAADVEQETWRHALEQPPKHGGHLRAWFASIARNVVRRAGRDAATRARHETRAGAPDIATAIAPAAAEVVERAQLQRRVADAVLALAEPYRSTILLRFFDDLAPSAIAKRTDVPVDTVKTRLKRGLAQLRERLHGEFAFEGRSWRAALTLLAGSAWVMTKTTKTVLAAAAVLAAIVGIAPLAQKIGGANVKGTDATGATPIAAAASPSLPATDETPVAAAREAVVETDAAKEARATPVAAPTTGTIRGIVVDHVGEPVAGATVYCGEQSKRGFERREQFFADVNTDMPTRKPDPWKVWTSADDGSFVIEGLDPFHRWSVGAVDPVEGFGFVGEITFNKKELEREVDLELAGGVAVVGSLRDPDGKPLHGHGIQLYVRDTPPGTTRSWMDLFFSANVDREGAFRMLPAPFHWYTLTSSASPDEPWVELRVPWTEVPQGTKVLRLDLQFERAKQWRGRVLAMDGSPARLSETLAPRLSADERARQSKETFCVLGCERDLRTNPHELDQVRVQDGRSFGGRDDFVYGSLDPVRDEYDITMRNPKLRFIAVVARNQILGVAECDADGNAPDVRIDLASLPDASGVRCVRLHVVDGSNDEPRDQATVYAWSWAKDQPRQSHGEMLCVSPHDAPAVMSFSLPIGECLLWVMGGNLMGEQIPVVIPRGNEPIDVTARLFPIGGSLRGEVLDDQGEPVAGARLRLYFEHGMRPYWTGGGDIPGNTDASGRFEIKQVVAEDAWLVVDAPGFAAATLRMKPGPDPQPCQLTLRRGVEGELLIHTDNETSKSPIRLRVLDELGVPVLDDLYPPGDRWHATGATKLLLAEGRYTVIARLCGGADVTEKFVATRGAQLSLTVR